MWALVQFLGFMSLAAGIWNSAAYLAFIAIIIGVLYERRRNALITSGTAVLAFYSIIFLHNPVFSALQIIVLISGLSQLGKLSERARLIVLLILTAAAYLFLIVSGYIANIWALLGSLGLLGIAFGLAVLPRRWGFLLMLAGGVLLAVYAFTVSAWVFFLLNGFYSLVNIYTWRKQ